MVVFRGSLQETLMLPKKFPINIHISVGDGCFPASIFPTNPNHPAEIRKIITAAWPSPENPSPSAYVCADGWCNLWSQAPESSLIKWEM
jgi:hypothetical protein